MTFSYSLSTDIGQLRFELGDTVIGTGVKSDGSNFTDEELQYLLTREGSLPLATAAACETLARDWAKIATVSLGQHSEQLGKVSAEYMARAIDIRNMVGGAFSTFSIAPNRVDGYSDPPSDAV